MHCHVRERKEGGMGTLNEAHTKSSPVQHGAFGPCKVRENRLTSHLLI